MPVYEYRSARRPPIPPKRLGRSRAGALQHVLQPGGRGEPRRVAATGTDVPLEVLEQRRVLVRERRLELAEAAEKVDVRLRAVRPLRTEVLALAVEGPVEADHRLGAVTDGPLYGRL